MKLQYNFDLLVVASLAMLVLLGLRRLLDLPTRLPRWNRVLSWLWLPAAVVFAVAAPFHYRNKLLDDGYVLFACVVLISTLLRLRGYRPARTVLLAVLPIMLGSVIKIGPTWAGTPCCRPTATTSKTGITSLSFSCWRSWWWPATRSARWLRSRCSAKKKSKPASSSPPKMPRWSS